MSNVIHVEPWPTSVSGPYLVPEEDIEATDCPVVEDEGQIRAHTPAPSEPMRLAFVDGIRRADAHLYQFANERTIHGVAGAHAQGAVVCHPNERPTFERCVATHLVIWGCGEVAELPDQPGGWSWEAGSVPGDSPDAPLQGIQRRMREAEGRLAEALVNEGYVTVVDGPLNFVRSKDVAVLGYVKTHHRALLPPEQHAWIPNLLAGERSSLFLKRNDIYSCYLRLTTPPPYAGPWAGIARLELPSSIGLEAAVEAADRASLMLPRFAGVAYKDPRAPQNLKPVYELERYLRRRLGDRNLAVRAIRASALESRPKGASDG